MSALLDETSLERITLDFAGAKDASDIVENLSGAAAIGNYIWTVSDEGRRLECLVADGSGYKLNAQYKLNELFDNVAPGKEYDLEDIAIERGRLWLCGSHCVVREKTDDKKNITSRIVPQISRSFLGSIALEKDGSAPKDAGIVVASRGEASLRGKLRKDEYLKPFLNLPSKENGLDIEGCALLGGRMLIGLRGPVLDQYAIVLELACTRTLPDMRRRPKRHFLNLGGFGIRGLARRGASLLVLAGTATGAPGEFHIHRWRPGAPNRVHEPDRVHDFPYRPEKPEGICVLRRKNRDGLLVIYDNPLDARTEDARYFADWYAFA